MPENYLHAAIEIAQEAGKVLVEELSRPLDIAYKGDEVDLVTQADKRSERLIVERLTKYFPEHAIAAEEGTGHESSSASEFRWHVDPLDGTTNFAHGYPCFCVSIALAQRHTLLAAPIFNIMVTSRSTLTEYAAMVPPRSISPLWQPAALTVSGNSALRNGTLLPAFCWSKKPAAK